MPVVGRYSLRTQALRREQSLWLWLPLSLWERGLGGEVAGRRRNALLAIHLWQDLDVPIRPMHADTLAIPDQSRGMLHPHDSRHAVLPRNHRAMGHQPPNLRHQALDRDEQRRPTRVRVGGDEDVARFEIRIRHVQDDARPPLDGPGGHW